MNEANVRLKRERATSPAHQPGATVRTTSVEVRSRL